MTFDQDTFGLYLYGDASGTTRPQRSMFKQVYLITDLAHPQIYPSLFPSSSSASFLTIVLLALRQLSQQITSKIGSHLTDEKRRSKKPITAFHPPSFSLSAIAFRPVPFSAHAATIPVYYCQRNPAIVLPISSKEHFSRWFPANFPNHRRSAFMCNAYMNESYCFPTSRTSHRENVVALWNSAATPLRSSHSPFSL